MKALTITMLLAAPVLMAAGSPKASSPAAGPGAVAAKTGNKVVASRFITGEVAAHIADLKRRLAINRQELGPFGLYQVPGKTPIVSGPLRKKLQKTPFSDYINQIQISVINAREKEFLVGARIFRLGQVFPIVRGNDRISVRVESVSASRVTFKNLQSGDIAVRKLNVLPDGVIANSGALKVRGVTETSPGQAQPLHLDFTSPPPPKFTSP